MDQKKKTCFLVGQKLGHFRIVLQLQRLGVALVAFMEVDKGPFKRMVAFQPPFQLSRFIERRNLDGSF